KIVFLTAIIIFSPSLHALNGICYKIGQNPNSAYNYQTKYFVKCDHDCPKTMRHCLECGHFHDLETPTIVNQHTPQAQQHITKRINKPTTPQEASTHIIRQARLLPSHKK